VASRQFPSSTDYVVALQDHQRDDVARRIGSRGSVTDLKGRPDLMLVQLHGGASDPRKAWEQAQKALGADACIQPVLLDADGKPQYPTGEVSVRFRERPSDAELERFASAHGLRLLRRNEFVSEQAVFEPLERSRYLPDLIVELGASEDIRLAWANTVAEYDLGSHSRGAPRE
jgi:hypothetical protein